METIINIDKLLSSNLSYLEPLKDINIIYHYTNIIGLKGILEDNNFNVSHARFMNDKMEISYTHNLIINELKKLKSLESNSNVISIYDAFLELMQVENFYTVDDEKVKYRASIHRLPEFVLSFSLNEDAPSIWSSFNSVDGYNLGIDFKLFYQEIINFEQNDEDGARIPRIPSRVIYDVIRQIEIIDLRITEFINIARSYDINKISGYYNKFISSMRLFALFFKNPIFIDDEEFRIVIYNYKNSGYVNPQYRIKGNSLIPYISVINYKKEQIQKPLPIKSITIGPKNYSDIAKEGLIYYMNDIGYDIDKIDYKKSKIPLRY